MSSSKFCTADTLQSHGACSLQCEAPLTRRHRSAWKGDAAGGWEAVSQGTGSGTFPCWRGSGLPAGK